MPPPFPDKPFIGMPGSVKSVEVSREDDRIVCYQAQRTFWVVQVTLFLLGLLAAYYTWTFWATGEGLDAPMYLRILVPLLAPALWLPFVRNLLGPPRVEILRSTGDILFFNRRTARPAFIIRRQDVAGFDLTEQFYGSLGEEYWRNLVLSLNTPEGKRIALCASSDEKLMHSFAAELASILKAPIIDASNLT
jgi:hypothetical protein